ncbi:hypothetical protein [[Mycobacterium] crassicus]|uniref:Uncharacterized protein n=1 Tax=[Mycobacterium] crassicus TaxID=2872309 RepID=A0ABU5XHQ0_9MYCO|nr:hypothetical protein [Mycolicibacter sp. MYC098]MEB3021282.1 hypothetical protein [Mycolicibacter sp. MYC098]
MNASADGDEPLGEHVDVTMPRTVSLIDRQTQALNEIRHMVNAVLDKTMSTTGYVNTMRSGEKACAAEIRAILDRLGV